MRYTSILQKYCKKLLISFCTGVIGAILYLLPLGIQLDEKFGLNVFFQLRGVIPAPPEVVVIAIDQISASKLKEQNQIASNTINPSKWPRALHADLIAKLIEEEVKAIAFDIRFKGCGSNFDDDEKLARAIKEAGNVIVVEELIDSRDIADLSYHLDEQSELCNSESQLVNYSNEDNSNQINFNEFPGIHGSWHRSALPIIANAALATAPFVLPRGEVTYYWAFKEDAGGIPLLPAVMLQIFTLDVLGEFVHILQKLDASTQLEIPSTSEGGIEVEELIYWLRGKFKEKPALKDQFFVSLSQNKEIDAWTKRMLRAVAELYGSDGKRYLNFYGPPRSIKTIPYFQVLQHDGSQNKPLDVKGKAVFVGISAAKFGEQDKLRDDYTTFFNQADGLQISGVEIAATAFANLLASETLRPIEMEHAVIILFLLGFIILAFYFVLPDRIAFLTIVLLLSSYYFTAYQLLEFKHLWIPLVVPLIQASLGLGIALSLKYDESNRERKQLQQAFGKYVPDKVVNDFIHNAGLETTRGQLVYGICMDTDAERYTKLSEKIHPTELMALMNEYYSVLFKPVKEREGLISDVKGDAMLAMWTKPHFSALRSEQACIAALEISKLVETFNRNHRDTELPTRIGLHIGEVMVGNVGTFDHYEYRAVGDLVNSANRIQNANKFFHTRVLLSQEVLKGSDLFLVRPLGKVLLHGKSNPIKLAELVAMKKEATEDQIWLCEVFTKAMLKYEGQDWKQAKNEFFEILQVFPNDGPTHFFLELCDQYLRTPPEIWKAVTNLPGK